MSWSTSELRVRLAWWNRFKVSSKISLLTIPRRYFFCGSFVLFRSCVCHAFAAVHCCLVVTWRERADLLAPLLWFCYFPIWYLGTGVVLDCNDSWSLLSFLLWVQNLNLKTCSMLKMLTISSFNGQLSLDRLKINQRNYYHLPKLAFQVFFMKLEINLRLCLCWSPCDITHSIFSLHCPAMCDFYL